MSNNVLIFIRQIGLSAFAAIVIAFPLAQLNHNYLPTNVTLNIQLFVAGLVGVLVLLIPFIRNSRNSYFTEPSKVFHVIHQTLICGIAINLFKWSFLTFFNLHLNTSLLFFDMPTSLLTGYEQMRHFVGQSYLLKTALGVVELIAGVLILLRPTRLLGAGLVVMVMANTILLKLAYHTFSLVSESTLLLCASLVVLWLDRERVFALKSNDYDERIEPYNRVKIPWVAKGLMLLIPLILVAPLSQKQIRVGVTGKYKVLSNLSVVPFLGNAKVSSPITHIYFDFGDYLVLTSSDFKTKIVGKLTYEPKTNNFECSWIGNQIGLTTISGEFIKSGLDYPSVLLLKDGRREYEIGLKKVSVKGLNKVY